MCTDSMHCGELMKRLNDILEKHANNSMTHDGITLAQTKMLVTLEKEGSQTLKELERHFGVAQATIAGIAVRLEKKGLIESFYVMPDKRAKHVKLTAKGHQMCKHCKQSMEKNEQMLLAVLSEGEREEFRRLLQKIYDNLSK